MTIVVVGSISGDCNSASDDCSVSGGYGSDVWHTITSDLLVVGNIIKTILRGEQRKNTRKP